MKESKFAAIFILLLSLNPILLAAPKREFRGAWIATVVNLDWPMSPFMGSELQQKELIQLIDDLHQAGFNAIIFQVRNECDAFYASNFEPWSYYLTGEQGKAQQPFYDPLALAIQEAHQRGMELHAWLNPYRAEVDIGNHPMAANHVTRTHPDWVFVKGDRKHLDPGNPAVRDYLTTVISDLVQRYDVDGVHFDDYFYPYETIKTEDAQTFANYGRGFTDIHAWRRDNVNLLVESVFRAIQAIKPHVKFGISPFGIWKNGVPEGISGFSAYDSIYCDPLAWLAAGTVDYIAPQCYWRIGGPQDYIKLVSWWAQQSQQRQLYIGQAGYRIATWSPDELPNQIRFHRSVENCWGSIIFRAKVGILNNPRGFLDSLKLNLYQTPALMPRMLWKDSIPPEPPQNLRYEWLAEANCAGFTWNAPTLAADGDTAYQYVLYRFPTPPLDASALENPANIVAISNHSTSHPEDPDEFGPFYYQLTALDRLANESLPSPVLTLAPPAPVKLLAPVNASLNIPDTIRLSWTGQKAVSAYHLQLSTREDFSGETIREEKGLQDTFKVITGLAGQQSYLWRVNARHAGGKGEFSPIFSFVTGFPATPLLTYPANNAEQIELGPTLIWRAAAGAQTYRLQVAIQKSFRIGEILLDHDQISDTTLIIDPLIAERAYYWRVQAQNSLGLSLWSESWKFRTREEPEFVEEPPKDFRLYQNYPNPFNNKTRIAYELPKTVWVSLVIYNMMGQEVASLVQEYQSAGKYLVIWENGTISTGLYICRLQAGEFNDTMRMIHIK